MQGKYPYYEVNLPFPKSIGRVFIIRTSWVAVSPETSLHSAVSLLSHTDARISLVCSDDEAIAGVSGVIGSEEIAGALKDASDLFPD